MKPTVTDVKALGDRRTLPRVRELKLVQAYRLIEERSRTLPRVRELKLLAFYEVAEGRMSHPSQGA